MKFNPTLPLAVALSVGVAGAVMAQTAPTQTPTASPTTQPAMNYSQPQANAGQTQSGYRQTPSNAGQMQASTRPAPSAAGQTPPATGAMPSATGQTPARPTAAAPSMASGTAASGTAPNGNEQVRMAQQRLHAAGIYNGPEDGIMDPDTRAAIARYQQQQGLRRSESLDPETLAALEGRQTTGYGSATPPATAAPANAASTMAGPSAGAMGGNAGKATAR
jgi:peptidoglycan hydrolase-like protein with peptidoglycan-binding domain